MKHIRSLLITLLAIVVLLATTASAATLSEKNALRSARL